MIASVRLIVSTVLPSPSCCKRSALGKWFPVTTAPNNLGLHSPKLFVKLSAERVGFPPAPPELLPDEVCSAPKEYELISNVSLPADVVQPRFLILTAMLGPAGRFLASPGGSWAAASNASDSMRIIVAIFLFMEYSSRESLQIEVVNWRVRNSLSLLARGRS